MAGLNDSLIDLDDFSDKNLNLDAPIAPVKVDTPSESKVKVVQKSRPTRTAKASDIGKESQKNEMAFTLYASINKELRAVDAICKTCTADDVALERLDACVDEIKDKAEKMTFDYAKLCKLSDNKVEQKVKKHFEFFIGEIGKITHKILNRKQDIIELKEKRDALEEKRQQEEEVLRIAEEEMEEKRRMLEDEQRKFEEYLAERDKLDYQDQQKSTKATTQLSETHSPHQKRPDVTTYESTPLSHNKQVITTKPLNLEMLEPEESFEREKAELKHRLKILEDKERAASLSHSHMSDKNDSIQQLANEITQGIKRTRKTDIEPDVFKGNSLEFEDWECDFDSYLSSMGIVDGSEKVRYLKKYVDGPAKDCIDGRFLIRTEQSYQEARAKLSNRYGNKSDVSRTMRAKLDGWPKIPNNDAKALQTYADYLENCRSAMWTISGLSSLNEQQANEKLARVLPDWAQRKWGERVHRIKKSERRYPKFGEFSMFVDDLAEMRSQPLMQIYGKSNERSTSGSTPQSRSKQNTKSFATNSNAAQGRKCRFCHDTDHYTSECSKLSEMPYNSRIEFLANNKLCFICARPGHGSFKCNDKDKSICKKCKRPGHATCLHKTKEDWSKERQNPQRCQVQPEAGSPQEKTQTPATQQDLPVNNQQNQDYTNENAAALSSTQQSKPTSATNLQKPFYTTQSASSGMQNNDPTKLSTKSTKTSAKNKIFNMGMPVYVSTTANPCQQVLVYAFLDSASDHSYITKKLATQLNPRKLGRKSIEVETMTGEVHINEVDIFGDIVLKGYFSGKVKLPSAYEWTHIPNSTGEFSNSTNVLEYAHLKPLANVMPPPMDIPVGLLLGANCASASFPLEAIRGKNNAPYALRTELGWTVFGAEDTPIGNKHEAYTTRHLQYQEEDDATMSQEDYEFMDIMENKTVKTDSGSYQMPLPFKKRPSLPNNIVQAKKRLNGLHKTLEKDSKLKIEYTNFMSELINSGFAEPVSGACQSTPGEQWYIPHFAVRHPQKQKLRVVFDCKAPYSGTSLNDHLLQGPDQMNSLVGILCRFRKEPIAISCDIQKMFYNFLVDPMDRDYLRFLWYDNEGNPQTYRMKVHLFGAKSSPAVATYGLRKIADDHGSISKEAAVFINRDFYVDDGITSIASESQAINLIRSARDICEKGNLRLHKFSSNSPEVLATLPESERNVQDKDLLTGSLPEQRTLGLQWSMSTDTFKFVNKTQSKPATRRGILSTVSQLYDPLGFIAPYTLLGKNILQKINKADLDWDDPITEEISVQWDKWMEQLPALEEISISRCLKPKNFGNITRTELHHFCDASNEGIGACSYIRLMNNKNEVHVSLLIGKSKVIPSKGLFTTPRLELMAAVMATKLSRMLHSELDMAFDEEVFWSDSMIVLGWIANSSKRFNVFVHNRLRIITAITKKKQWHYLPGYQNPADIASRGRQCDQLEDSIWFSGPSFLSETTTWPLTEKHDYSKNLDLKDPELKKTKACNTQVKRVNPIQQLMKHYSDRNKVVRTVTLLRNLFKRKTTAEVKVEDLKNAEVAIITAIQQESFSAELLALRKKGEVQKNSHIKKLNPFVDAQGLLRVGGRAKTGKTLTEDEKHPICIPKNSDLAKLLIQHHHKKSHHMGSTYTLSAIRSAGYWLISGTRIVKSIVQRCVICKKLRAKPMEQKMGELPEHRLEKCPPFTHTGIDCFGPFNIKERRTSLKKYGLVFTCLYSRAIHIELLDDLSADAFLNALRCFIALRGDVRSIYCDNGTNFIGGRNILEKEAKRMLAEQRIDFFPSTPTASHQGGLWERQIRTIRSVLGDILRQHSNRMDTAALRTAFCEVIGIVNNRPLGVLNLQNHEDLPITPNMILTGKVEATPPPPGDFREDIYCKARWKKVQCVAEEFWDRWKLEYLDTIMKYQKWTSIKENVKVDDIVLLIESDLPRNAWRMGRVSEVYPGKDGLVRKARVRMATRMLDKKGNSMEDPTFLDRPIQKLIKIM